MGGVATKIVERNDSTPILIAGRKPLSGKVLIAIDGSENALRATDFAGRMLAGYDIEFHLVAISRGVPMAGDLDATPQTGDRNVARSPAELTEKIVEARTHLIQAGVSSEQVSWQVITGVHSRAAAIVEEAEGEGCDTIILGRRGHSRINYFFIGSVSAKVIQLGREYTVWVIP
jgi:nucleotide-binding universal stress UspA family protein